MFHCLTENTPLPERHKDAVVEKTVEETDSEQLINIMPSSDGDDDDDEFSEDQQGSDLSSDAHWARSALVRRKQK